jgi:hypothetical protein
MKKPTQKRRKTVSPAAAILIVAVVIGIVIAVYFYALAPKTLSESDRAKATAEARKFWGGTTPMERGGLDAKFMWTQDEMKAFIKEHGRPPTQEEAHDRLMKALKEHPELTKPTAPPTRRMPTGVTAP